MKNTIKVGVIILTLIFGSFTFVRTRSAAQTQTKAQVVTAGQHFKNIKVLNDMPADQIGKVMNVMSASLGVNCAFCHFPEDFAKDGKREKETARNMIRMTFDINKNSFNNRPEVSCNTCHSGHENPRSAPNLNPVAEAERPKQPDTKPTAAEILAKYAAEIGSKDKLAKISSRHIVATRVEPNGTTEPEDVWFGGNGNYRSSTTYPQNIVISEGFDGTDAWKVSSGSPIRVTPDDLVQIKREAQLFANPDLSSAYSKLDYRFLDAVDGRPAYLVTGTTADNQRDRLYFDVESGLLVRRISSLQTAVGPFQYQYDYSDYKDFGGVKIPTTIKFAMPNIRWTRKVTKVKINAPIAEGIFHEPKRAATREGN